MLLSLVHVPWTTMNHDQHSGWTVLHHGTIQSGYERASPRHVEGPKGGLSQASRSTKRWMVDLLYVTTLLVVKSTNPLKVMDLMRHVCANSLSGVFFPANPLQPPPRKTFQRTPKRGAGRQRIFSTKPSRKSLASSQASVLTVHPSASSCCPHWPARAAQRVSTLTSQPR
jgi:hypothetical protein